MLAQVRHKEPVEVFRIAVVRLVPAQRHQQVAPERGIHNPEQANLAPLGTAPREFGPEAHADSRGNGILDGRCIVALERDVGAHPEPPAELVADAA